MGLVFGILTGFLIYRGEKSLGMQDNLLPKISHSLSSTQLGVSFSSHATNRHRRVIYE